VVVLAVAPAVRVPRVAVVVVAAQVRPAVEQVEHHLRVHIPASLASPASLALPTQPAAQNIPSETTASVFIEGLDVRTRLRAAAHVSFGVVPPRPLRAVLREWLEEAGARRMTQRGEMSRSASPSHHPCNGNCGGT